MNLSSWDILPPESKRYTFEGQEQPGFKEMLDANGKVIPWDGKRYRIVVGGGSHVWAGKGFALYLNGEQISEMPGGYYKNGGGARGANLFENLLPQVDGKEITIAVKAFLRQNGHRNKAAPPSGHLSVWLEEMKLPPAVVSLAAKASQ